MNKVGGVWLESNENPATASETFPRSSHPRRIAKSVFYELVKIEGCQDILDQRQDVGGVIDESGLAGLRAGCMLI